MTLHLFFAQIPIVCIDFQCTVNDDEHHHQQIDTGEQRIESGRFLYADRQHDGQQKRDTEGEQIRIGGHETDLHWKPFVHMTLHGLIEQRIQIFAVTSGDRRRTDHIFENQCPTDDEGYKLTDRYVTVTVSRTCKQNLGLVSSTNFLSILYLLITR